MHKHIMRAARVAARTLARAAVLALPLAWTAASSAVAQEATVGLGLGWAAVPRIFSSTCSGDRSGQVNGAAVDLRAGLPAGGLFAMEARLGAYAPAEFTECALLVLPPPDGVSSRRQYRAGKGGTVSSDLRLRWEPVPQLVIAGGGGWLWAAHAPYLAVAPGIRAGGRVRFVADLDVLLARFPSDVIAEEYRSGSLVREISRTTEHEWRNLTSVRVGLEVALPRRGR